MNRVKGFLALLIAMPLLLPLSPDVSAQVRESVVGKIGIGVNGMFNFPVQSMRHRFQGTETWGIFLAYANGPRSTVEVEYHRIRYDPGKLQESTFYWPEDQPAKWQNYKSPLARNFMTVNSFTVNGFYHFVNRAPAEPEGLLRRVLAGPFLMYGAGFYHYNNKMSGFIFGGQPDTGVPIDQSLVLSPRSDTDVAWGFYVGAGVEILINDNTAIDLRGRYHMMIGELIAMEAFNAARLFPMTFVDFGVAMKYYIGRL